MRDALDMRHLVGKMVYLEIIKGEFKLREMVPDHESGDQNVFLVGYVGTEG